MRRAYWGSWLSLRSGQRVALLLLLVVGGAVPSSRGRADQDPGEFVHETVQRWSQGRERHDDLQVSVIDVRFRAEPPLFAAGEGVVVAPVALELAGAQRVLDVASRPPAAGA
jgi:hypothetical protein